MSAEYNSNLISQLYRSTDEKEIIRVLNEMEEIGDAVFLNPVLDAYEKYINTSFGHYFIASLGGINSKDIAKYLDEVFKISRDKRPNLLPWVLCTMSEHEYFTPELKETAKILIQNFSDLKLRKEFRLDDTDLGFILDYLEKSKIINESREKIRGLLLDSGLDIKERAIALSYLLKISPSEEINYFIENYEKEIKNSEIEILLAKELLSWKGANVQKLKEIIINNGNDRAKEILEKEQDEIKKSKERTDADAQRQERIAYSNAGVVKKIGILRRQINNKTQSHPKFQFKLFPANELLLKQTESSINENALVSSCIDLRSILQNINKEVEKHGLDELTVNSILSNSQPHEKKKSLNQFYLFLYSKEIDVDDNLFGLRGLNRVLNLLAAHPENQKGLLEELEKNSILKMYQDQKWSKIHNHLLNLYKQSLDKLNSMLT